MEGGGGGERREEEEEEGGIVDRGRGRGKGGCLMAVGDSGLGVITSN